MYDQYKTQRRDEQVNCNLYSIFPKDRSWTVSALKTKNDSSKPNKNQISRLVFQAQSLNVLLQRRRQHWVNLSVIVCSFSTNSVLWVHLIENEAHLCFDNAVAVHTFIISGMFWLLSYWIRLIIIYFVFFPWNFFNFCFKFIWHELQLWQVRGHGRLMDPPSRNAIWRFGFYNPVDQKDNELWCGGVKGFVTIFNNINWSVNDEIWQLKMDSAMGIKRWQMWRLWRPLEWTPSSFARNRWYFCQWNNRTTLYSRTVSWNRDRINFESHGIFWNSTLSFKQKRRECRIGGMFWKVSQSFIWKCSFQISIKFNSF